MYNDSEQERIQQHLKLYFAQPDVPHKMKLEMLRIVWRAWVMQNGGAEWLAEQTKLRKLEKFICPFRITYPSATWTVKVP
jgi:hypothetical protein